VKRADASKSDAVKSAVAKKIPPKKKYQASASKPAAVKAPRSPAVSAATKREAAQGVGEKLTAGAAVPVENPAALAPFFELLYKHQNG
jgi:hypothetical protein